jgi:hypothetical protein
VVQPTPQLLAQQVLGEENTVSQVCRRRRINPTSGRTSLHHECVSALEVNLQVYRVLGSSRVSRAVSDQVWKVWTGVVCRNFSLP